MTTTTLAYAKRYLARDWYSVPIPFGQKKPTLKGWQDLRLTEAELPQHFSNGNNIGLLLGEPSGDLVDIDVDCPFARALAAEFLPQTELTSGRESAPRSHYWYSSEVATEKFIDSLCEDRRKAMLVEIRSTGGQTVVAPSTHPTGEQYEWHSKADPAAVSPESLRDAVQRLAACALLARYWCGGKRHDLALAVAGSLLRHGWSSSKAEHFITCAARAAGDTEIADRREAVVTTAQRLEADRKCNGIPALRTLLPAAVVDKFLQWLEVTEKKEKIPFEIRKGNYSVLPLDSGERKQVEPVPWPELDQVALYGVAGDFVRLITPHTESDPVALLIQSLAAFGSVIGRGPHFRIEADTHFLNIFGVLVGETGTGRKGTSWGQVRQRFEAVDPIWNQECVVSGASSGEGLLYHVRDQIVRIKKNRKTGFEEEEITDPGVTDKRLFVFEGELGSLLRTSQRDGNTVSAVIRNLWDTGTARSLVKNSPIRTTDAHVSILGHIVRYELLNLLSECESINGFANRFLWLCVRRSKFLPRGGQTSLVNFNPITLGLKMAMQFAAEVGEMTLSDEAWGLWDSVYMRLETGRSGFLGKVTQRASPYTLRLACLYALLDCEKVVSANHLTAALALWQYAEDSARYIFGARTGDKLADQVLDGLQLAGDAGMTLTELNDHFHGNEKSDDIGRALLVLADAGLAQSKDEPTGKPGRIPKRWFCLHQSYGKKEINTEILNEL